VVKAQELRISGYENFRGKEFHSHSIALKFISQSIYSTEHSQLTIPVDLSMVAGVMGNIDSKTSYVHAGLLAQFARESPVFSEFGIGGAINDGAVGSESRPGCAKVGCHTSFWFEAGIGFNFNEHWAALITAEHISNGNLCPENNGLNLIGLNLSYRF
jgi:hypothetical protein